MAGAAAIGGITWWAVSEAEKEERRPICPYRETHK